MSQLRAVQDYVRWGFLSHLTEPAHRCQSFVQNGRMAPSIVMPCKGTDYRADLGFAEIDNTMVFVQVNVGEEDVRLSRVCQFVPSSLPDVSRISIDSLFDRRF